MHFGISGTVTPSAIRSLSDTISRMKTLSQPTRRLRFQGRPRTTTDGNGQTCPSPADAGDELLARRISRETDWLWYVVAMCIWAVSGVSAAAAAQSDDLTFFEKRVRPLLIEHCFECHSASSKKLEGDLHLDTRDGILQGSERGAAVKPGNPSESPLVQAIRYETDGFKMPPGYKLTADEIATFEHWIEIGAPYPVGATRRTDPATPHIRNVLFILSDDMRPELACYGQPSVRSPNIDALAKAGVRFDRAYCQYPLCNPSRTSLLTGRHPTTTGVLDNTVYFRDAHPDWLTLPQHFKNNGYVTVRVGKIFHGGIDDAVSWSAGAEARQRDTVAAKVDSQVRAKRSDQIVVLDGDGETHGDYRSAEQAIQFLRKYKDERFFLTCGFTKPHSPPTAPKRFFELYDASSIPLPTSFAARVTVPAGFPKASLTGNGDLFINREASSDEARRVIQAYWASISWTDWNVGRVIAELDRLNLRDNTVIVFWGDHGYHLGEMGKWSKHGSLFEVGTRVPMVLVVPGAKANGDSVTRPVQSLDLFPTLCELAGLAAPPGLEGHSLTPFLADADATWDHPAFTVAGNRRNLGVAVRTAQFRYAEWGGGKNGAMLFDESTDPTESCNLADDPRFASVRAELSQRARAHASIP